MPRFSAALLAHFKNPCNAGEMTSPSVIGEADLGGRAPRMKLYLRVEEGRIRNASFQAFGCGVMIAAASALVQVLQDTRLEDCRGLDAEYIVTVLGGVPEDKAFCASIVVAALEDALLRLDNSFAERS